MSYSQIIKRKTMSINVNLFVNVLVTFLVLCQCSVAEKSDVTSTTEINNLVTNSNSFLRLINRLRNLPLGDVAPEVHGKKESGVGSNAKVQGLLQQVGKAGTPKEGSANHPDSGTSTEVKEQLDDFFDSNADGSSQQLKRKVSKHAETRKAEEEVGLKKTTPSPEHAQTTKGVEAIPTDTIADVVSLLGKTAEHTGVSEDLTKEEEVVSSAEELEVSADRVQRVLNAFHEVTDVLAEVPKQIWMLPLRFGFIPGIKRTQDVIPDMVPFPCENVSGIHYEPAISVHRLRPQDIKVVASLGDSITAANGAMAYSEEETRLNYRGISAMGGGQGNWRKFLTLPNIIKEFSPKLQGYALGAPEPTSPLAGFNLAENGALDDALLVQAKDLVSRIRGDPYVNYRNDWKIVNILIGGNDVCNEFCFVEGEKDSPVGHLKMLEAALRYLKAKLPRTLVNLIHIPNILQLRNLKNVPFVCYAKQLVLCSCLFGGVEKSKAQAVEKILQGYWEVERNVSEINEFDTDDFTVVLQPFFLGVESPTNLNTIFGEAPDLNLFAPDCFHFSQRSHALIANALWNNMWEPVGNKTKGWKPIMNRFLCPSEEAPFFFTRRNSEAFLEQGRQ